MPSRIHANRLFSSCALIRLFAIAVVLLMLVSACGGGQADAPAPAEEPAAETPAEPEVEEMAEATEPPAEEAAAPAEEATPEAAAEAPAATTGLSVAVNASFPPFLFTDDSGNLAGFDIDLMNALSAAGNFEVGYEDRSFDGMLEALAAGDYDAAMSAITINDTRRQIVDFTEPYFQPGQAPVSFFSAGQGMGVRSDEADIMGVDSLPGGSIVGVKRGTTGDDFASELESVTVVRFDESEQTLDALVDGAVDAAIVDIAVITNYIKESQGQVKLVGGLVTEEEYGIAVNPERPDVLDMLNAALEQVRADGTYDAIFDKWFGTP